MASDRTWRGEEERASDDERSPMTSRDKVIHFLLQTNDFLTEDPFSEEIFAVWEQKWSKNATIQQTKQIVLSRNPNFTHSASECPHFHTIFTGAGPKSLSLH